MLPGCSKDPSYYVIMVFMGQIHSYVYTLPKTNIASENGWLEHDRFLLGQKAYFHGLCCWFQGGYIYNYIFQ